MPGAAASPFAFLMIAIWWAGVVLLGLALAYAMVRAGRLRRDERARLDQTTQAMVDEETRARVLSEQQQEARSTPPRFGPRRDVSNGFALPGVVAFLAILLMILATAQSPRPANQVTTTGRAPGQPAQNQEQPVRSPATPGNQPGSDSARGDKEPLTRHQ
ncbi:MAG TPA: hypothetical protein VKR55_23950 [Bradyrhizobium sp.]|uniref:hypothetical protein n=1 Tax=Bradyrhizobium sp. TaxID=376 RepID=UPI002C66F10A|nr:hypothetical protein [Bradyrhizobium sp.]HLZ05189.1 hypothetical protein [Bradyrhizobium sp.]